jgi:hypothetical protein
VCVARLLAAAGDRYAAGDGGYSCEHMRGDVVIEDHDGEHDGGSVQSRYGHITLGMRQALMAGALGKHTGPELVIPGRAAGFEPAVSSSR